MKTLIFMTIDGMGDIGIFWPIWREIARQSPGGKVSFLITPGPGNAQNILKRQDWVEDVHLFNRYKGSRGITPKCIGKYFALFTYARKNNFDSVWMFQDGFKYFLPFYLGGIRKFYNMSEQLPSWFFKNRPNVRSSPPIESYQRYLSFSKYLGKHTYAPENLVIPVLDRKMDLKKPYITLGIGGTSYAEFKRWPVSYWSKLIQMISEIDTTLDFHLVGGSTEVNDMKEITDTLPHLQKRLVTQINLDIEDLLFLLKNSTYTVANDTGVLNMSSRVETGTYGLYGRHSFKAHLNPESLTSVLSFNPQITPVFVDSTLPFDLNKTDMDKIMPEQVIKAIYQK